MAFARSVAYTPKGWWAFTSGNPETNCQSHEQTYCDPGWWDWRTECCAGTGRTRLSGDSLRSKKCLGREGENHLRSRHGQGRKEGPSGGARLPVLPELLQACYRYHEAHPVRHQPAGSV